MLWGELAQDHASSLYYMKRLASFPPPLNGPLYTCSPQKNTHTHGYKEGLQRKLASSARWYI